MGMTGWIAATAGIALTPVVGPVAMAAGGLYFIAERAFSFLSHAREDATDISHHAINATDLTGQKTLKVVDKQTDRLLDIVDQRSKEISQNVTDTCYASRAGCSRIFSEAFKITDIWHRTILGTFGTGGAFFLYHITPDPENSSSWIDAGFYFTCKLVFGVATIALFTDTSTHIHANLTRTDLIDSSPLSKPPEFPVLIQATQIADQIKNHPTFPAIQNRELQNFLSRQELLTIENAQVCIDALASKVSNMELIKTIQNSPIPFCSDNLLLLSQNRNNSVRFPVFEEAQNILNKSDKYLKIFSGLSQNTSHQSTAIKILATQWSQKKAQDNLTLIFTGPPKTGKKTLARHFAEITENKFVLCNMIPHAMIRYINKESVPKDRNALLKDFGQLEINIYSDCFQKLLKHPQNVTKVEQQGARDSYLFRNITIAFDKIEHIPPPLQKKLLSNSLFYDDPQQPNLTFNNCTFIFISNLCESSLLNPQSSIDISQMQNLFRQELQESQSSFTTYWLSSAPYAVSHTVRHLSENVYYTSSFRNLVDVQAFNSLANINTSWFDYTQNLFQTAHLVPFQGASMNQENYLQFLKKSFLTVLGKLKQKMKFKQIGIMDAPSFLQDLAHAVDPHRIAPGKAQRYLQFLYSLIIQAKNEELLDKKLNPNRKAILDFTPGSRQLFYSIYDFDPGKQEYSPYPSANIRLFPPRV